MHKNYSLLLVGLLLGAQPTTKTWNITESPYTVPAVVGALAVGAIIYACTDTKPDKIIKRIMHDKYCRLLAASPARVYYFAATEYPTSRWPLVVAYTYVTSLQSQLDDARQLVYAANSQDPILSVIDCLSQQFARLATVLTAHPDFANQLLLCINGKFSKSLTVHPDFINQFLSCVNRNFSKSLLDASDKKRDGYFVSKTYFSSSKPSLLRSAI